MAVAAGVGSLAAGLVQATVGEPTTLSRVLTIIFPTVITLWLVGGNALILGVATSVDHLIGEHESIIRSLAQVHMPRMSNEELGAILNKGFSVIGLDHL